MICLIQFSKLCEAYVGVFLNSEGEICRIIKFALDCYLIDGFIFVGQLILYCLFS